MNAIRFGLFKKGSSHSLSYLRTVGSLIPLLVSSILVFFLIFLMDTISDTLAVNCAFVRMKAVSHFLRPFGEDSRGQCLHSVASV